MGAGLVRAGPARERERSSRQDPRDLVVPVLRIRDAVQWWCLPGPLKPRKRARPPITDGRRSAAREAVLRNTLASPLAAVSLAFPGQTAPSRHHHCTAHWAASPPRDITPPGPFYAVGFVAANFPRSAGIGCAHPGPYLARDGQIRAYRDVLAACPGWAHPIPVRALWRERSLVSRRELRSLSRAGPAPTAAKIGPCGHCIH